MLETIYITRHANRPSIRVDVDTGQYYSSYTTPTGIPTDPALVARGVDQSKELAAHLTKIDPPVDRIYSSPMYRCLQTLQPSSDALFAEGKAGGKIRIDRGLGEFYGKAEWTHASPPTLAILKDHFKNLDMNYEGPFKPDEHGELIAELHERVKKAIAHVIQELDNDPEEPKTLLICTHAATMICLGRALTGKVPDDTDTDDFQCFTASLSTFKRCSPELVGSWECVKNSDTSYLKEGEERGWHFNGEEDFVDFSNNSAPKVTIPAEKRDTPKL